MTDTLPSKPKRKRRNHSPEFKAHVVALCQEPNASRAEIARRFDLNDNLVHKWCVDAKRDGLPSGSSGFIELPQPKQAQPDHSSVCVTFKYTTNKGTLIVEWPISQIVHSAPWIKALGL